VPPAALARQHFDVLDPLSLDLALRHNSLRFFLCVGDEAGRRATRTLPERPNDDHGDKSEQQQNPRCYLK